ncbi:MAG: diaminopimelate epimerase [Lachnospiraceae bacterium]|nr:diaminopimelate epimerase [Lachnospiraceae bacterium]
MKFTKMHGTGNDYIYVNGFEEAVENKPELAIRLSDRHFGIGSDGMIFINPSDKADFEMEMYNADGSRGKMCGNGIRCVGKYVYDNSLTDKTDITVETLAGIKTLKLHVKDGKVDTVRVNMGAPEFEPSRIPVALPGERIVSESVTIDEEEYLITCVSMGNPHAVIFVSDTDSLELEKLGPLFENNSIFPDRVNTEFVEVIDRTHLKMRVWERGSGETFACGTGACAVLAAAVLNEKSENTSTLILRGGELNIEWSRESGDIFMTGPAETVFTGEVSV